VYTVHVLGGGGGVKIRRDLYFFLILSGMLNVFLPFVALMVTDIWGSGEIRSAVYFFCNPVICNHLNEEEYCMLFYSFMSTCTVNGYWKAQ
jgi:hypothetical protein